MMYNSYVYAFPTQKEIAEAKISIMRCIRSQEGGMPISQLTEEYRRQTGEVIPFFRIGYLSVFHMLRDIPEIRYSSNQHGEEILIVPDDVVIEDQPVMETNEGASRKRRLPYPPQGSPQSPASVQMIQQPQQQTMIQFDVDDVIGGASSAKKSRVIAVAARRRFAERSGDHGHRATLQYSRG